MNVKEILKELKNYGSDATKKIYLNHGAKEPFYGVKSQDLKKIQKRIKKDHDLALELYATGNSDAMYLASLIADETKMTKKDLRKWAKEAYWYMISEYMVPWVAAESKHGFDLGLEWIESKKEGIASAGWSTLSFYVALKEDDELNTKLYKELLDRVQSSVHEAQNRVRFTMNGFVIAVGSFTKSLTKKASAVAKKIGKVDVDMGGTSCKVPLAADYIKNAIDKGRHGKKRKSFRF